MQSIQKINVDISRDRNLSEPSVYAKQNDSNSRKVEVTLFDSGVQLSSLTASGKVFFGKGNNSYFEKIEITNGVTEFIIPQNALSSSGRIQAEILILNDTDTEALTSATFIINCHTQINPSGAINGENNGDILGQILERIEQIQASNMSRTPLPDGAIDLNTFITSGWWYTTEQRIDITNTPKDLAELELIVTKDVLSITQILIACDGGYGICYRFSHNSGKNWTDWQKIATDADVSTTNLVNGSAEGSLRSVDAQEEDENYKMGDFAVALGQGAMAIGESSFAEGVGTRAEGYGSHAEGMFTVAKRNNQHVQGVANIVDEEARYAHIVGNGNPGTYNSNAHTLDWDGNAWFAGDVYVGGTSQDNSTNLSSVAAELKEKLDGIEDDANKTIVDSELSATSTNPVQNKVIAEKFETLTDDFAEISNELDNKVSSVNGKSGEVTLTGNDIPLEEGSETALSSFMNSINDSVSQVKEKLDGIEEGANKTIVDSELSDTSTNPVQNKVVAEKINSANSNIDKKVNLTNGTIYGAVDWNTITTTGCYKIQNCTMTADYNAPPNEYVYGVLQVLNSENETGEYRVTQIYIPRSPQRYSLWIRTNNSATGYDNWNDWIPFNNAFQLYTKFSTKADIETGTCTLTAYSNTVFGTVSNEILLNWASDTSKYYTTGSTNPDGTLTVQGAGNARIINAYNINATGTVGVEFAVSGTGAIKIEIKGGGTTYTSGNISLSTNTQKIQITHAISGITVLNDMEINIYASGETALTIENLLKITEASTRTFTGNYELIGNQVTVSVFVDNLQNGGEITLYPLPFVPKLAKSGVCGAFSSSAIYYEIYGTTARIYLNDAPQSNKQLTFYYTI